MKLRVNGQVLTSIHSDRFVREEGDRFVKVFTRRRDRDAEVERLRWLREAGIGVPDELPGGPREIVTARLPGTPLDTVIRERWRDMSHGDRNALMRRVADLCRMFAAAGLDWPDLVTYHIFVAREQLYVLDPARLRRGQLELSALFWSAEEPTVSRTERLRFWRYYTGDPSVRPPSPRAIGSRGRFRPYRWVLQRGQRIMIPAWSSEFVTAIDLPFGSPEEMLQSPDLFELRRIHGRINAYLPGFKVYIKVTPDEAEAKAEWSNHRKLLASGFRVPHPAAGGVLQDGRGLFASVALPEQADALSECLHDLDVRRAMLAVADYTRRLHAGGLVHKDLYLCHFFGAPDTDQLALIDLARVHATRSWRLRVKDLAAIVMSAREMGVSWTLLYRCLRRYGGGRALARIVVPKARRMARHVPLNIRQGVETLKPPCT
ncbi:MAG: lipopolysaccharide kinase InaA family protein [Planctomycetota bacterium]